MYELNPKNVVNSNSSISSAENQYGRDSLGDIVIYRNRKVRILAENSENSDFTDTERDELITKNKFICVPSTTIFCELFRPQHVSQTIEYFRLFFTFSVFQNIVPNFRHLNKI